MTKDLTLDVRYVNDLAWKYYGDGKKLAEFIRKVYDGMDLTIPDEFDSTSTFPPIHFIPVSAPDETDIDKLRNVDVPNGLLIEVIDLDEE